MRDFLCVCDSKIMEGQSPIGHGAKSENMSKSRSLTIEATIQL